MSHLSRRPHRCGIVLSGGDGRRLQHFVLRYRGSCLPKQYVNFTGMRSMLEHTLDRAEYAIDPECLFTVIAREHTNHAEVGRQLRNRPSHTVVVQPANRESGPGLLLALMHLIRLYPNSTVALFPSDHVIIQEELFMDYVRQAFEVIEAYPSRVVFLGAEATKAETQYCYILPENQEPESGHALKRVKAFVESPTPRIATQVTELGALWNTMAMVFKPEALMHLISLSNPKLSGSFLRIFKALNTARETATIERTYRDMPSIDFSRDLLGPLDIHSRNQLFVLPLKGVLWSDWDSPSHILSTVENLMPADNLGETYQREKLHAAFPSLPPARLEVSV